MLFSFQAWLRVNSRAAKAKKLGVETRILQPLGCAPPDALLLAPSECPGPPPPRRHRYGKGCSRARLLGEGAMASAAPAGSPQNLPSPRGQHGCAARAEQGSSPQQELLCPKAHHVLHASTHIPLPFSTWFRP